MDPSLNALQNLKTSFQTTFRVLIEEEKVDSQKPIAVEHIIDEKVSSAAKKNLHTFLRDQHTSHLSNILSISEQPKIMILDNDLIGPLGRMIPVSELKNKGVKIFYSLDNASFKYKKHHFVYIVQSSVKKINELSRLFAKNLAGQQDDNLHMVYTIPRHSMTLGEKLHENGLSDKMPGIEKYALNIFPMSEDLLSLELRETLNAITNRSDPTPLLNLADAVFELEKVYGKIENVNFIGKHSERVVELLKRRRLETDPHPSGTFFARLTLIDRVEDLITPYLIPSTYEALIDEFIGITDNFITLEDKSVVSLEDDSDFYLQLKDSHISNVKNIIHDELEKIRKGEEEAQLLMQRPQISTADIGRALKIAKELATRKNRCQNHIQIAQILMDKFNHADLQMILQEEQNIISETNPKGTLAFIDDMLNRDEDIHQILRLLFLYIQIYGNLSPEFSEDIYNGIIQTFGYEHLFTLKNHEELAKLRKPQFAKLRDSNHLIHGYDANHPKDIAYTYNGYAPLSCRLIEQLISKPLEKPTKGLELVCFVGGCTRAEISACRLISNKIIVLTTDLINGNTLVDSLKCLQKKKADIQKV